MAQIRVRNSSLIREKRDPKNDNGPPMTGPQRRKNPVTDDNTKHIKNKLPKNLRYDLENALLGLCDVWYEEIKPHLMRNNIKLHVHNHSAGERPADSEHCSVITSGMFNCSHIDPGAANPVQRRSANYVNSSTTQPTASRAPCHKLSARQPGPSLQVPTLDPVCEHKRVRSKSVNVKNNTGNKLHPHVSPSSPSSLHTNNSTNENKKRIKSKRKKKKCPKKSCMKREIIVPLDNEFYDTSDPEPKEKLFSEDLINLIVQFDKNTKRSRHRRREPEAKPNGGVPAVVTPSEKTTEKKISKQKILYPPWK